MTYWLGIDLGTTYTAAALCRPARGELETHVVQLGSRSPAVPSVLFLARDGSVLIGEAAEHYALTEPDRVVREFKRRIGDEIPLMVGGEPWQAHELAGVLVHRVWQWVNEREGELPAGIALTCPASWGPFKVSLFEQAVQATRIGQMTRLGKVELLSEPQAAAIGYASREHVEVGAHLAVYDLGGGTFDAAVVRKDSPSTFTLLGRPEGIDGLGGVTFDEMLFEHVCGAAGVPLNQIDPNDPRIVPEVARLRRECTVAKEALSADTETTIDVALGGVHQRVRLTRAEFEEMIRPELDRTIEALHRALDSAGVDRTQLDAILLAGGSSRIPLVSQLIAAEFGWAPAIDADPKLTVAVGAARYLAPAPRPAVVPGPAPAPDVSEDAVDTDFRLPAIPPARPEMATMLTGDQGSHARPVRRRRRYSRKAILGLAAGVLLVAGTATALAAPHLSNDVQPSAATPVVTTTADTPVPVVSGSFISAKPSKKASKTKSTASSPAGTGASQGSKAGSSLAAVPGPSKTMPTAAQTSKSTSASATPTRTHTTTPATSPATSTTSSTATSPSDGGSPPSSTPSTPDPNPDPSPDTAPPS